MTARKSRLLIILILVPVLTIVVSLVWYLQIRLSTVAFLPSLLSA